MNAPATTRVRRRLIALGAALALAGTAAACGSDDPTPQLPEGGTGNPSNDAIIASESHDPILLDGGNAQMMVAVDCDPPEGDDTLVTVAGEGIEAGTYVGTFEPETGVDLVFQVAGPAQALDTARMTLDAEEYTVTFPDIESAVFEVRGCPS